MRPGDAEFDQALIGYQLGICDEAERAAVEAALSGSDEARRRSKGLAARLRPLGSYQVNAPAGLVANVMRRIETAPRLRLSKQSRAADRVEHGSGSGPLLTMRELMSLAAAILLLVTVFIPGYGAARTAAQRNLCLNQMRVLGEGYGGYAQANAGIMPFAGPSNASIWGGDTATPLPNAARNMQVLVREKYVPGQRYLICPAPQGNRGGATNYSSQLFVHSQRLSNLSPAFPVVSDPNPLIRNGAFIPTTEPINSNSHGPNAGQTVLYLGGDAAWRTRPTVGIDNDDIFRINNLHEYSQPLGTISDSFLIP